MLFESVLCLLLSIISVIAEDVLVTIPNGRIRGRKEYSLRNISFYAFQQIPFAKPPLGKLRFRDPEPAEKWTGILNATVNDKMCFQQSNMYRVANLTELENEDCLYLNVYTPVYPNHTASLPVMFYIYGGGFVNGASNFDFFGPHYLMENGVIVVTANYRVGPFGFLSTGDMVIPGNYGLKDQNLALRWVRDNIKEFGGDPEKVTIFGQSAGAASVTFQMMSKQSTGLFRAAIAQSGSALCPWAYQRNYKDFAYNLASYIDPNFNTKASSEELLEFLQNASAAQVNDAANSFHQTTGNEEMVQGFWFTPVIEPEHATSFLNENMYAAIEKGHMNRVPFMIGICAEEQIAKAIDLEKFKTSMQRYESDLSNLVNRNMHLTDISQEKAVGEAIRNMYTDGLFQDHLGSAIKYFSDTSFTRAIIHHAKMQSTFSDVYFYQFSYRGRIAGNRAYLEGADNVGHSEDNHYLWAYSNHSYLSRYDASDILTSNRFRALFTNFAKELNPTPTKSDLFENITWPKVNPNDFEYLDINASLSLRKNPKEATYSKWVDLYEKTAIKPYDTF